jgi:hypothetical protein
MYIGNYLRWDGTNWQADNFGTSLRLGANNSGSLASPTGAVYLGSAVARGATGANNSVFVGAGMGDGFAGSYNTVGVGNSCLNSNSLLRAHSCVGIGQNCLNSNSRQEVTSVGNSSGNSNAGQQCSYYGFRSGFSGNGSPFNTAVGAYSMQNINSLNTVGKSVALGYNSMIDMGQNSIECVGVGSGSLINNAQQYSISVGAESSKFNAKIGSINVGSYSCNTGPSDYSINIGYQSNNVVGGMPSYSVSLGAFNNIQNNSSYSIACGSQNNINSSTGTYIGGSQNNITNSSNCLVIGGNNILLNDNNTIVIGNGLSPAESNALYINPIRQIHNADPVLTYNFQNKEIRRSQPVMWAVYMTTAQTIATPNQHTKINFNNASVDTLGFLMAIVVHSAGIQDRDGGLYVL